MKDDILFYTVTENEFFDHLILGWGDRDVYSIETEEVFLLLSFGGVIKSQKDNGDGTYSMTIRLRGKTFICMSTEVINAT